MQESLWSTLLRRIPPAKHDILIVVTAAGVELMIKKIIRLDEDFVILRGRLAGSSDQNRIVILPYARFYLTTVSSGATGGIGFLQDCPSGVDGNWQSSSGAYTYNAWHHIAATYDSATGLKAIYVDGVLRFSTTLSGPINAQNAANAVLGNSEVNGDGPFVGTLDE